MISTLELRHIIEQSFLPIRCQCAVDSNKSLTVRIYQNTSGRETLVVTGISVSKLTNGRDIAGLISELRYDLKSSKQVPWHDHN
ncbi:DUF1652 domain-containing protein [Pseudomonas sp. 5S4]|nr:DUF1652 domain-containing protein [Pseudomonas sp. 10S5]MEA9980019.1 DUF1652 domain-containing protein [Pseudomonas sp. RTS4]MEB0198220.1 DUF1652 domain-containing protein [Pseudomonas sp. 5S4]MEB0247791.1 DUF1652 domain-containing protein [Pseudomonas sp. 10S5]